VKYEALIKILMTIFRLALVLTIADYSVRKTITYINKAVSTGILTMAGKVPSVIQLNLEAGRPVICFIKHMKMVSLFPSLPLRG
jgi:hypothetical protein